MGIPRSFTAHLADKLDGRVLDSPAALALYSTDASNYRHLPLAVVIPRSIDDLVASVLECTAAGFPILVRGAGTSLAGQACNEAVVIDGSRHLDRIARVDLDARTATVEPGLALQALNDRLSGSGLCFAPDPSTKDVATLGGMFANNSCGVRSVRYGTTAANVRGVKGLTSDGVEFAFYSPELQTTAAQIAEQSAAEPRVERSSALAAELAAEIDSRFSDIPRRISGYNLDAFAAPRPDPVRGLCGSEGTLAVVTELELELVPLPAHKALAVLGFSSIEEAASAVPDLLETKPLGLEAIDAELAERCRLAGRHIDALGYLPQGAAWLLVEFDGESREAAVEKAADSIRFFEPRGRLEEKRAVLLDGAQADAVWRLRKSALAMATLNPRGPRESVGWEDAAVPPRKLAAYLESFSRLTRDYGLSGTIFGHFGDGCVHTHLSFDFSTDKGRGDFERFIREAAPLVVEFGGSLSGEHGDGQARSALLETMYGSRIVEGFRRLKKIWDPDGLLNPNRIADAPPPTADLRAALPKRIAPRRRGPTSDEGTSALTEEFDRCVGAGLCVRKTPGPEGGTMCPTYMATLDERHSTRGRARLLFEMAVGTEVIGGWKNDDVAEALELCIGCKACRSECPAAVDMASYRSEFFYQRYGALGLGRSSITDLFLGTSPLWLRAIGPSVLRRILRRASDSGYLRRAMGLVEGPEVPKLSIRRPQARVSAFAPGPKEKAVILWPDCFSVNFDPSVYESACELLRSSGIRPLDPGPRHPSLLPLCCGRPFIESGMMGLARSLSAKVARILEHEPSKRLPIVFLEPSCLSVFRCDLERLLPTETAERLRRRSMSLSESLVLMGDSQVGDPGMNAATNPEKAAAVFLHCHQRALWGAEAEMALLNAAGVRSELVESGCCGMAGKFGISRATSQISHRIYERQVKLSIDEIPKDTVILADGFSCRRRLTAFQARAVMHIAEFLHRSDRPGRSSIGPES